MKKRSSQGVGSHAATRHTPNAKPPKPATKTLWLAALLFAATFAAYFPAWEGRPIWDDDAHITRPELRTLHGLARIWIEPRATQQYYPLTHTAFWLEQKIWGDSPLGHHLANICLHAFCALLVVRILERLQVPGAWLAGMVFALHPIHVESVAWISELKNTLSGLLYLGAALAYLKFDSSRPVVGQASGLPPGRLARSSRSVWSAGHSPALGPRSLLESGGMPRTPDASRTTGATPVAAGGTPALLIGRTERLYLLALFLFVLGLVSKTVIASLPAALVIVFWWKRGALSWRRDVWPLLPFFAAGIAAGLTTAWVERELIGAHGDEFNLPLLDRGLVAGRAFWFYLYKLCWPLNLVFIYPRWQINHRLWWQYLFPLAAGLLAAGLWGVRHRSRAPSAALLFFAGTLFPALGFLNVYPFRYSYVADHFQYLASLGMIVLISAGAAIWWRGLARRPAWGGAMTCVAFLATLAILTWHQSGIYADQETLWTDTLKKDPNTWIAHNNLGTALQERNDLVGAEEHFLEALALHPRYDEALANLGMARARQGKITEAIDCLRRALEISPAKFPIRMSLANALCEAGQLEAARSEFLHVLQTKPDQADAHLSLAALYLKQGNTVESLRHEKEAMRLKPESVPVQAYEELAARLFQQQDFKEAAFYYAQAAKLKPDDARTQASLGICLAITKEYQKALPCLRQAVRLDPQNPSALNELAWILATAPDPKARDGPEAVRLAKQACALTQERSPHLLGTLDAAYAEAGQFPEAIQTAEKVRQLCLSQGETELAQQAEQRLAAYRAGKPWRGP